MQLITLPGFFATTKRCFGYKAKEAVIKYLRNSWPQASPRAPDAICHVAVAHVPADLVDEIVGLKDYLNSEKHKVPDDFTVNAKSLKEKTRIRTLLTVSIRAWSVR